MEDHSLDHQALQGSKDVQLRVQTTHWAAELPARSNSRSSRWINPNVGMGADESDHCQDGGIHVVGRDSTCRGYGTQGAGIPRPNEVSDSEAVRIGNMFVT